MRGGLSIHVLSNCDTNTVHKKYGATNKKTQTLLHILKSGYRGSIRFLIHQIL